MPGPPQRNVTPKSNQISAGYNPRKPLASRNGVNVFQSQSHAAANSRLPVPPSAFSRMTKGMGMLGQAPVLLRNMIDTSAVPENDPRFDVSGEFTKQRQQEMNALHLGANTLQDILTMGLGPAAPLVNFGVDAAYQANYPAIDEWMRNNIMRPKWKHEDDNNLGVRGVQVKGHKGVMIEDPVTALAGYMNSPTAMKATVPMSNAKLPKSLAGYRGHMVANMRPNAGGQANYGSHWLDLITDALNPVGYLATEALSGPAGLAMALKENKPLLKQNKDTGKWEEQKERFGFNDAKRVMRDVVLPRHAKDLKASIQGIGRATQDSFIP